MTHATRTSRVPMKGECYEAITHLCVPQSVAATSDNWVELSATLSLSLTHTHTHIDFNYSTEGFCEKVDTTCSAANTCKTCDTFGGMGGKCTEIDYFPNATVSEFGLIDYDEDDQEGTVHKIMSEIYSRGPVAATINAEPIVKYAGGIFTDEGHSQRTNHIVSITGWGKDESTGTSYWIVR
jgi:Papain family cysteine protease